MRFGVCREAGRSGAYLIPVVCAASTDSFLTKNNGGKMGFKFDEPKDGERWLILNEKRQEMPDGLKVVSANEEKSSKGTMLPVLKLEHPTDGSSYKVCAWTRDCAPCINEYGTDPMTWGLVGFALNPEKTRWVMIPKGEHVIEERISE